jgi:hypothetical protein
VADLLLTMAAVAAVDTWMDYAVVAVVEMTQVKAIAMTLQSCQECADVPGSTP